MALRTRKPDDPELRKFREMWADELAGAALYRKLAEHADEKRRSIFLSLAYAEERHAAHWAELLRQAGFTDLRPPAIPFRVRALGFLRPPWGLAYDRLYDGAWAAVGD